MNTHPAHLRARGGVGGEGAEATSFQGSSSQRRDGADVAGGSRMTRGPPLEGLLSEGPTEGADVGVVAGVGGGDVRYPGAIAHTHHGLASEGGRLK